MKREKIRIASYNVHSWVGRDGRCDSGRVVDVIRELEADVVALQEAKELEGDRLTRPLAKFCDESGFELIEGSTLQLDQASYGNALLCAPTVNGVSRLDLSVSGREPRGALRVNLELGSFRLLMVATHLGLRARERSHQTSRLLEWIQEGAARTRPNVISLAGDINEWRGRSGALRRIDALFGSCGTPRSFPAARPWFRLDRIWVLPRSLVACHSQAHRSARSRIASDHLPVYVDLELPHASERAAY